jgi:transposase-like protein
VQLFAGQLTEHWTQSVWRGVAEILRNPPKTLGLSQFSHEAADSPIAPNSSKRRSRQVQNRLSRAQVDALVADYQGGASIVSLATAYRVDPNTVYRWLKVRGAWERRYPRIAPDDLELMAQLRADGWSLVRLGARFGCSHTTVGNVLARRSATESVSNR